MLTLCQGELILRKIEKIPKDAKPVGGDILSHSETGHHHRFRDLSEALTMIDVGHLGITVQEPKWQLYEAPDKQMFARVKKPIELFHDGSDDEKNIGHKTYTIPPGDYNFWKKRELDMFGDIRSVAD